MDVIKFTERPFSNWSLRPYPGEPAHGFFGRLVANEGHSSARAYAADLGLASQLVRPSALLKQILKLPLPEALKQSLVSATAVRQDDFFVLGANLLRPRQMSFRSRRFCRRCLAVQVYHRAWWDLPSFQVCPVHGDPIEDRDSHMNPIPWWLPHFDSGADGKSLIDRTPVTGSPNRPFEDFVVRRLSGEPGSDFELLDGVQLHEVVDAAQFLSRLLLSARSDTPPPKDVDHTEGFLALVGSQGDLIERLRAWFTDNTDEQTRRQGVMRSLGWAWHLKGAGQSRITLIDKAVVLAFSQIGRLGRPALRRMDVGHAELTLAETLRRFEGNGAVRSLAVHLGLIDPGVANGVRHYIDLAGLEKLDAALDELISHQDSKMITGLRCEEFSRVIASFPIGKFNESGRQKKYLASEIRALVDEATRGLPPGPHRGAISLDSAASDRGLRPSDIVVAVLKGSIQAIGKTDEKIGFNALLFERVTRQDTATSMKINAPGGGYMTFAETAIYLGIAKQAVASLAAQGLIDEAPSAVHTARLFRRADIHRFGEKYASTRVYSTCVEATGPRVTNLLRARGVEIAYSLPPERPQSSFVERAQALTALSLSCDPDQLPDAFWSAFRDLGERACPQFAFAPSIIAHDATVGTQTGLVVIFARRRSDGTFVLAFNVRADTSPRRWARYEDDKSGFMRAFDMMEWYPVEEGVGMTGSLHVRSEADFAKAFSMLNAAHEFFSRTPPKYKSSKCKAGILPSG